MRIIEFTRNMANGDILIKATNDSFMIKKNDSRSVPVMKDVDINIHSEMFNLRAWFRGNFIYFGFLHVHNSSGFKRSQGLWADPAKEWEWIFGDPDPYLSLSLVF